MTDISNWEARFRTMRHIEAVRNYLAVCIRELMNRQIQHDQSKLDEAVRNYLAVCVMELVQRQVWHDQSKLESPEVETFDRITSELRGLTYGGEEYRTVLREGSPAMEHHYAHNRHHPEHHKQGIAGMTLIDLLEMLCDWKAASLRHDDGDIFRSLEINQQRFDITDQLCVVLCNTVEWLHTQNVYHRADES